MTRTAAEKRAIADTESHRYLYEVHREMSDKPMGDIPFLLLGRIIAELGILASMKVDGVAIKGIIITALDDMWKEEPE